MAKGLKRFSIGLTLSLLVTAFASFTASAAEERSFETKGGGHVTISNVVEVQKIKNVGYGETMYVATAPVTITFHGELLDKTEIAMWPDDESLEYVEIKDQAATLTEPVKYGIFPVFKGEAKGDNPAIILQVIAGTTKPGDKEEAAAVVVKSEPASAVPTASKVSVDGKAVSFEAYNIDGNNYFKLRDLAMAVNGSAKNFEVGFDQTKNAISLTSGKAYMPAGGELAASAELKTKQASLTTAKLYLDGKELKLTAYNIDGNNYFKLRDVAKAFDFGVAWDGAANSIGLDTKAAYKEE